MANLSEKDKLHIDTLLQDFSSIKSEISRRSNLQRIVQFSYLVLIAYTFRLLLIEGNFSMFVVLAIWAGSFLAIIYYIREKCEIERLGAIIKNDIASIIATKLEVTEYEMFPSETNKIKHKIPIADKLNKVFIWSIFWVIPVLLSLMWIPKHINSFYYMCIKDSLVYIATIFIVLALAICILCILIYESHFKATKNTK